MGSPEILSPVLLGSVRCNHTAARANVVLIGPTRSVYDVALLACKCSRDQMQVP